MGQEWLTGGSASAIIQPWGQGLQHVSLPTVELHRRHDTPGHRSFQGPLHLPAVAPTAVHAKLPLGTSNTDKPPHSLNFINMEAKEKLKHKQSSGRPPQSWDMSRRHQVCGTCSFLNSSLSCLASSRLLLWSSSSCSCLASSRSSLPAHTSSSCHLSARPKTPAPP